MDLKLFFDPIPSDIVISKALSSNMGQSIYVNQEKMPDFEGFDIAIIGLREGRGQKEVHQPGLALAADAVRRHLYELKKGANTLKSG